MKNDKTKIYAAELWNPQSLKTGDAEPTFSVLSEGAIAVDDMGCICACGPLADVRLEHPSASIEVFKDCVLIPGFIDCHLHMPQLDMIGAHGRDLLNWLNDYTFPFEARFAGDGLLCQTTSQRLVHLLLQNGVTTAAIYTTSDELSTDAMFAAAETGGLRAIIGKVSMDRHAPATLLRSVEDEKEATPRLIERWHGKTPLLHYALTPRFAPSCSSKLLDYLGQVFEKTPGLYVQSHLSETLSEVSWVRELFKGESSISDYLAVYEHYGLTGKRTIYGHGIHLSDSEMQRLAKSGTTLAHCPTSNAFLGSGVMPVASLQKQGVRVGLASDIGAGTSLSPWQTMLEAYKLQRMAGHQLTPAALFYMATLGGAEALGLSAQTGSLDIGKSADFTLINWKKNPLLQQRFLSGASAEERLFATITLGDDRLTEAVYVGGEKVL